MSIAALKAPIPARQDPNHKWIENFEKNKRHALAYSRYFAMVFGVTVYFDVLQSENGVYLRGYIVLPFLYMPITIFRHWDGEKITASASIQDFRDIGEPKVTGDDGELEDMSDPKPWHYLRSAPLKRKGRGALVRVVKYRAAVRGGFTEVFANWQVFANELLRIAMTETNEKAGTVMEYGTIDHKAAGVEYVPQDQRVTNTASDTSGDDFNFAE